VFIIISQFKSLHDDSLMLHVQHALLYMQSQRQMIQNAHKRTVTLY